jgi:hypothetical protein
VLSLVFLAAIHTSAHSQQAPLKFVVQAPSVKRFSGKVVVYLGTGTEEPRFGPNWFSPKPCYSADFRNGDLVKGVTIDNANAIGFPGKLHDLAPGSYTVQAVVDQNLGGRAIGASPGNLYSAPITMQLDPNSSGVLTLNCDQVVQEDRLQETDRIKEFRFESPLLSSWYKRTTFINSAVVLPEAYSSDPTRKFPILYLIPGFGGDSEHVSDRYLAATERDGEQFIVVILDPNCPTGHSVFADSANNGPWGMALTTEFIPALEKGFRTRHALRDRPLKRRLVQPLASGRLSRRVRRSVEHISRSGRFPRLSEDRPLRAGGQHVQGSQRRPSAACPPGYQTHPVL